MNNQSIDSVEQVILGLAMSDPDAYAEIASTMGRSEFSPRHQKVWRAINDCFLTDNGKVDQLTVAALLGSRGELNEVGGHAYIDDLRLSAFGSSPDIVASYCARIVSEDTRRKLKKLGQELTAAADKVEDPNALRLQVANSVLMLDGGKKQNEFRGVAEVVSEMRPVIAARAASPIRSIGIPTGYAEIDYLWGGVKDGYHLLAGRASMGKTAMMLSLVLNVARTGAPCGIISIEMKERDLINRMLAQISGIPSEAFETGWYEGADGKQRRVKDSPEDLRRMEMAQDTLASLPISINTHSAPTATDIRISLTRLLAQTGAAVAWVDHLHLMSDEDVNRGRAQNLNSVFTVISRNLKQIPKDLGIPLVCLAQLNRMVTTRQEKRPELQDLRESGSLEQDAATVTFVHREDYYHRNDAKYTPDNIIEWILAKNQLGGRLGTARLFYEKLTGTVYPLEKK